MDAQPYSLNLEQKLVRHCTPALAALKPANLFTCRDESAEGVRGNGGHTVPKDVFDRAFGKALRECRTKLEPCGVRIEVLARRKAGILLYVYRPTLVSRSISQPKVARYLAQEGYDPASLGACVERLHRRICGTDLQAKLQGSCSFPHEIGFFLGYPYDDVVGFIENQGENFLACGCWKVYSQERDAQECFCCYKNCTAAYELLYAEGVPIECLAAVDENFPAIEAYAQAG